MNWHLTRAYSWRPLPSRGLQGTPRAASRAADARPVRRAEFMNSMRPLILLGLLSIVGSCHRGGDDALVKDVAINHVYQGVRVGGEIFDQLTVAHFKQIVAVAKRSLEPGETIIFVGLTVEEGALGNPLALVSTQLPGNGGMHGRKLHIVWHDGQWRLVKTAHWVS